MEKKTMGSFMAALRKVNGLTQQQVAEKLNVSNKTISKWECNEGYPEITMLPVIAELYSVTVDELLRGERITKISTEESRDTKSEERLQYLIEKASVKFTNNSIISIILGVVALILTYTICDIVYNYNVLWGGYVIILVLSAISIAVAIVAFNNLISSLRNEDIVEKQSFEGTIIRCIKYITVVAFLSIVTLLGLILNVVLDAPSFLFVCLPATAIVGGVLAYFVCYGLYKKYAIQKNNELSSEQKRYRKKHIKITSIFLSIIVLISVLAPFVCVFIESLTVFEFNFTEAVGYQYSTYEEAENEYYKLKNFVVSEKTLYNIIYEDYDANTDTYTLYLTESYYNFRKGKKGFDKISLDTGIYAMSEEITQNFASYEEMEKFKAENTYNDDNFDRESLGKNITFEDENLTVSYMSNRNYLNGVLDILPVFVIIGSCVCITVFVVSLIVYTKKIKRV